MQKIYGFLPETKCRQTRLDVISRVARFFSKRRNKFLQVKRAWGGIRISAMRKRVAAPVALPLAQYKDRILRGESAGKASRFKWRAVRQMPDVYIAAIQIRPRHYAGAMKNIAAQLRRRKEMALSLFDRCFPGAPQFYLIGAGAPFGHRNFQTICLPSIRRPEAMPWTRDEMHRWERANCAQADRFVREETS